MNYNAIIADFISQIRLSSFENIETYKRNLQLSKHSYVPLAVLEVSLRNKVNDLFITMYDNQWLLGELASLRHKEKEKIRFAKEALVRKQERITQDKLVAELNFGFWTALFQSAYSHQMRIGNLKKVFPSLPARSEAFINRGVISRKLNHIRKFRNRVFHYENIVKDDYSNITQNIAELIGYLDPALLAFVEEINL